MDSKVVSILLLVLIFFSCQEEINPRQFPGREFKQILAFKMTGDDGEIVENGRISKKAIGKGVLLSTIATNSLLKIFQDEATYGEVAYSCFEPHVGYVFYNEKNEIIAYTSICLKCNWMKSFPAVGGFAFSENGNQKLKNIEKRIFEK